jgi:hypothetical protein
MIALAVLITIVALFWLGRLIGREEATVGMLETFARLYDGLSVEDKLLFDKWMREFKERENK